MLPPLLLSLALWLGLATAAPYDARWADYNMNTNPDPNATVLDFTTRKFSTGNDYFPSPTNWRQHPVYTVLLDKHFDAVPENNDYFHTLFEWSNTETQVRHGGDITGLVNDRSLDYMQLMGIKAIFVSGTPFLNMPWQADGYSALDFTLIDPHWGTVQEWADAIHKMHERGMYFFVDLTITTMGNLIVPKDYMNNSAPFNMNEYEVTWNRAPYGPWNITEYPDFKFNNVYNESCEYPQFWDSEGRPQAIPKEKGCMASDFDQYGDMEAFGIHPDWQRQLTKFSSVQDRLRDFNPKVKDELIHLSCLLVEALDVDGYRIDKGTQLTVDFVAKWSNGTRACARELGKTNFMITGEITGGDQSGALYIGRGTSQAVNNRTLDQALAATPTDNNMYLREDGMTGYDGTAFHYSVYRVLQRLLQMDGNLDVAYDVPNELTTMWQTMLINEDLINSQTKELDPRNWMAMTNHDIFRWPSLVNGTQRQAFGQYVTFLLIPGVPLVYYGEEQSMYIFDNTAANYLFGRQAMTATPAWQRHGCYKLGSTQYHNFEYGKALFGCDDFSQQLDHFDPTADYFRFLHRVFNLRDTYPSLMDGFQLANQSIHTYFVQFPGSNNTQTEIGLRSMSREPAPRQLNDPEFLTDMATPVWMLWHNENKTTTYDFVCGGENDQWIRSPYPAPVTVKNLFYPYESVELETSSWSFNQDGKAPYRGCMRTITLKPYSFGAYVPVDVWYPPPPTMTHFSPGHDARLLTIPGAANETSFDISFEYDREMDGDSLQVRLYFTGAPGSNAQPTVGRGVFGMRDLVGQVPTELDNVAPSAWKWTATVSNAADGIYEFVVGNVSTYPASDYSGAPAHLLVRKGRSDNVMVFTEAADYNDQLLLGSPGSYKLNNTAVGADLMRYSGTYGVNWTDWMRYETEVDLPDSVFEGKFWDGQHIQVQYHSNVSGSSAPMVQGDLDFTGGQRRFPKLLARGDFNQFGYDQGVQADLEQKGTKGEWQLPLMSFWPSSVQLSVYGYDDFFLGDTDGDGVLDRLPPNSLSSNFLNMTAPPKHALGWTLLVNDHTGRWTLQPRGHSWVSLVCWILLIIIPPLTALITAASFRKRFYAIKINKYGVKAAKGSYKETEKDARLADGQKVIGWPEDPNKRRKIIIATLEYEILDWKIKVKIGGLGVMSKLMGTAMEDCDLVWVIPKVGGVDYPAGESTEPIEVIIFGEPYLIECEIHVFKNITYYILDSPVFRAQTKSDPYPARMDDLSSAVFYSTWNQAIAEVIRRNPIVDIYHINDYHGTLAPLYLLPKIFPTCLSLHNAEFQGLWPLRNKEEMNEVCAAFNLPKEVTTKYVMYGNTFNLLHAGAAFIAHHQKSIGVAGVSDKYGKRSWARYPALWILKHIDSLPNPDPDDIDALDEQVTDVKNIQIDRAAEAKRPGLKRQAQEWAGIDLLPDAQLFVFVGRWSKQKGVDIIADVFPALLEKNRKIQLIAVGPVIDLYGRFAAEKLARLMEMYPKQVFSKPEFTSLPPYLFSGADFALIPSRDEPFGLVAVEFGRKGALGVGARLGGLGLMPGWWFPVESISTSHMISQLQKTIKLALKSTEQERAVLRARSAVQRFPVIEWRQRTEILQKRSIRASRKEAGSHAYDYSDYAPPAHVGRGVAYGDPTQIERQEWMQRPAMEDPHASFETGSIRNAPEVNDPYDPSRTYDENAHPRPRRFGDDDGSLRGSPSASDYHDSPYFEDDGHPAYPQHGEVPSFERMAGDRSSSYDHFLDSANRQIARQQRGTQDPFFTASSRGSIADDGSDLVAPNRPFTMHSRRSSAASISSIVDEHGSSSPLNKAMETFTDANGVVAQDFVQKLKHLDSANSKGDLCIEKYLEIAEKQHFKELRREKIETSKASGYTPSLYTAEDDENLMPEIPMTRMQIFMGRQVGEWPFYSIVMSAGQLLSASAFQLVLLSGTASQTDLDLYVIGAVFFTATIVWWSIFRTQPSSWGLSFPWLFFALAFFLIGLPSLHGPFTAVQTHLQAAATWCYAIASAAAFLFFGMNFGEEAGATTQSWIFRACVVQGLQQCWAAILWWWGSLLINNDPETYIAPRAILAVVWPLSIVSFLFFFALWFGLPQYYLQRPPTVPNFYATLFRRDIVRWFLVAEILRDFWLAPPVGRNWKFLWSNPGVPVWAVFILVLVFFIGVWALVLLTLTRYAKIHSWLLPVFAIGLGAPRWCQMFWSLTGVGHNLAWAGSFGPFLSVATWLWLGVLDAVQGVGLGMALLQTLSRFHVNAALMFCQCLGSIMVILARLGSPDRLGPYTVFPNFALWDRVLDGLIGMPLGYPLFWICLFCQILIVVGYLWLFRKEQLNKP